MRTLKLTLAYDGTEFVGWQRQAEGRSVQGLLEDAARRSTASQSPSSAPAAPMPACTRSDRWRASSLHAIGARPADDASCAERRAAVGRARAHGRRRGRGLPRALRRRRQDLSLPHDQWPVVPPFGRATPGTSRGPSTSPRWTMRRGALEGEHDFGAFQADRRRRADDRAREMFESSIARVADRSIALIPGLVPSIADTEDSPRLLGDGLRLPAAHGARDRRHAGRDRPRAQRPGVGWTRSLAGLNRADAGPTAPAQGLVSRPFAIPLTPTCCGSPLRACKISSSLRQGPECRLSSSWRGFRRDRPRHAGAPGQLRAAARARRDHHGRQRPLGGAAPPAARRRPSRRHRFGPRRRRDLGAARHRRADAVRVLGRELEAAARRSQHADDAAQAVHPARARARCSRTTSASA